MAAAAAATSPQRMSDMSFCYMYSVSIVWAITPVINNLVIFTETGNKLLPKSEFMSLLPCEKPATGSIFGSKSDTIR